MDKKKKKSSKLKHFLANAAVITAGLLPLAGCVNFNDGITTGMDEINTDLFESSADLMGRVDQIKAGMTHDEVVQKLCEGKSIENCNQIKDRMNMILPEDERRIYLAGMNSTSSTLEEVHDLFNSMYGLKIAYGTSQEKGGLSTKGYVTTEKSAIDEIYFIFDSKTKRLKTDPVHKEIKEHRKSEQRYWKVLQSRAQDAI